MTRKRDINDWFLWLILLNLYRDKHSWIDVSLCLVGAVMIYIANRVIDEKMEVKE